MRTSEPGQAETTVPECIFLVFSTALPQGQLKNSAEFTRPPLPGSQPRTYHRHQRNGCGAPSADRRCRRSNGPRTVVSGIFNLQPASGQGSAALGAGGLHGQGTHPRFALGFPVDGKLPLERAATFSFPLV